MNYVAAGVFAEDWANFQNGLFIQTQHLNPEGHRACRHWGNPCTSVIERYGTCKRTWGKKIKINVSREHEKVSGGHEKVSLEQV